MIRRLAKSNAVGNAVQLQLTGMPLVASQQDLTRLQRRLLTWGMQEWLPQPEGEGGNGV